MKSEKSKMAKVSKVLVTFLINGKISRQGAKCRRGETRWNVKPFAALRLGVRILLKDFAIKDGEGVEGVTKRLRRTAVGWALLPVEG